MKKFCVNAARKTLLLWILLTILTSAVNAVTAPQSNAVYKLRDQCSNKILDVFEVSSADLTDVVQWTENSGKNQQFGVVPANKQPTAE